MPLPTPNTGEKENEFISRCMANDIMNEEYPDSKQRSGVCYSQWRAKESKEGDTVTTKTKESLSMENLRSLLDPALIKHLGIGKDDHAWIEDMTETELFYRHNNQSFKATYELAEDNSVVFGESEKVARQVVYKTIESLQRVYSEVIQEAGKRNASLDSTRIKKILELCQELLSSDGEPDEKKIAGAAKEAEDVIKWLQTLESSKTEDGVKYPMTAYAYAPESDKPAGWKLRLWEDLENKVTRAQLGKAAAALSPGGFRGQKVQIPTESLSAVKRKIWSAYKKLGIEEKDIPKWVKETTTRELIGSYIPLTEAKFDKGKAQVVVIKAGFNATEDRYYPEDMLKRDYKIFEGQKMYADHPTEAEDKQRPERSIRDWVATLTEVKCDEDGTVTGIAEIVEPWMMQKLASLRDKNMLSEMGISINAVGHASKGKINGKNTLVIEELTGARSVDFVTEPGAGGVVTFYESDRTRDIDLIELSTLKEKRPDLVESIETNVRESITEEVKKVSEQEDKIKDLETQIETLTTERDGLKEAAAQAAKEKLIAEAQKAVREAVDQAELPEPAKERLIEKFKDAESADGIAEAIQAEKDYLAKLAESGKVKGLGPTKPENDDEKSKAALRESLKMANPEWTDAQLDTAVAGR